MCVSTILKIGYKFEREQGSTWEGLGEEREGNYISIIICNYNLKKIQKKERRATAKRVDGKDKKTEERGKREKKRERKGQGTGKER